MQRFFLPSLLLAFTLGVVGCGQESASTKGKETTKQAQADDSKHSGWWCDEHGVKESECSMCSAKVAKAFQAKKDWCEIHNRAKSQCFICDPSLREKFAAQYKAKYGKEPPEPADNMPAKDAGKS